MAYDVFGDEIEYPAPIVDHPGQLFFPWMDQYHLTKQFTKDPALSKMFANADKWDNFYE